MSAEPLPTARLSGPGRLAALLDEGSFAPFEAADGALLLGSGEITGRRVFVHVRAGEAPLTADDHRRLARMLDAAAGAPVVGVFDSPGARDEPAVLAAQGQVLRRQALARAAGTSAPRIAVVLGQAIGFDALLAASHHVTVLAEGAAQVAVTGPALTAAVTNEWVSGEALGGAAVAGPGCVVAANEVEALLGARRLVQLACPGRAPARPAVTEGIEGLGTLPPSDPARAYAMDQLVAKVVDASDLLEVGGLAARNVLTGLARIGGHGVGVVATRPDVLGGALDGAACRKLRAFADTCRALGLPLVTLVDVPGFLPGVAQEHGGLAAAGGDLAAVMDPVASVVVRCGFGPALAILSGRTRACWADARLGATRANVAADPVAAGLVDRVIAPEATRSFLIDVLDGMTP